MVYSTKTFLIFTCASWFICSLHGRVTVAYSQAFNLGIKVWLTALQYRVLNHLFQYAIGQLNVNEV
jgi:hypothetical protein